jgi:hypothetical protein
MNGNLSVKATHVARARVLAALLCVVALTIAACEKKGPGERVGEKFDHAADTIKNGGEEPTKDKIQDQADKARDAASDAADKVKGKD